MTYETPNQAKDAIVGMSGQEINGRQITVEISKRTKERTSTPGIYLGPNSAKTMKPRFDRPKYDRSRSRSRSRSYKRRFQDKRYERHEERNDHRYNRVYERRDDRRNDRRDGRNDSRV